MSTPCPVAVLISGNGSNLQALIDASPTSNFSIVGVISNNPDAYGLQRARENGIPAFVIDHREYADRSAFDQALLEQLKKLQPELVILAGFMRILTAEFVRQYTNRILNIHPSLLPKYPGTNTHRRVLEAGDENHGVSVHFVTEDLDGGPVAAQAKFAVRRDDTIEQLEQRIHSIEHVIYPHVVSLFASGKLRMHDNQAWLDEQALPATGITLEEAFND